MIGRVTAQDAIQAAAGAVNIVDRMAGQMAHAFHPTAFYSKVDTHPDHIRAEKDAIVASRSGEVVQRVTVDDILRLPEDSIRHILVLQRAIENHYEAWLQVFPRIDVPADPVIKHHWRALLRGVVSDMTGDVEEVMGFLEKAGLRLDGHYDHVRELIRAVGQDERSGGSLPPEQTVARL